MERRAVEEGEHNHLRRRPVEGAAGEESPCWKDSKALGRVSKQSLKWYQKRKANEGGRSKGRRATGKAVQEQEIKDDVNWELQCGRTYLPTHLALGKSWRRLRLSRGLKASLGGKS